MSYPENMSKVVRYHIDVQSLLLLPGNMAIFWKDLTGTFLGCNDVPVEAFGYQSRQDIIGRKELDLPVLKSEAKSMRDGDLEVIRKKQGIVFNHTLTHNNLIRQIQSFKAPLYNSEGIIMGVYGIDSVMNELKIIPTLNQLANVGVLTQDLYTLVNNFKLSKRQHDCLVLLAKGFTLKKIAKKLNISPRTVEDYLRIVKEKLNCDSREELLVKAIKLNLLDLNNG